MKYEDLVRILEEEEKKPTLSKQVPDLYSKLNEYIKELETEDRKVTRKRSIEAEMIHDELKNAYSNIDKLFKRRVRKIIKMASGKAFSKEPSNIDHDIENMTPEERKIYSQVLDSILTAKRNTIEAIMGADIITEVPMVVEQPPARAPDQIQSAMEPPIIETPIVSKDQVIEDNPPADVPEPLDAGTEARQEGSGKKDLSKEYIVVRILKDIPTFIGTDGRNYTLGAQDVAVLPKVNSKALIKRKVAIPIEPK